MSNPQSACAIRQTVIVSNFKTLNEKTTMMRLTPQLMIPTAAKGKSPTRVSEHPASLYLPTPALVRLTPISCK